MPDGSKKRERQVYFTSDGADSCHKNRSEFGSILSDLLEIGPLLLRPQSKGQALDGFVGWPVAGEPFSLDESDSSSGPKSLCHRLEKTPGRREDGFLRLPLLNRLRR